MSAVTAIPYAEAIDLGIADSIFYSHFWFPDVARQDSPAIHEKLWTLFESNRFSNAEIFRGGAKTTIARLFMSKRVAYGISHTVLFIGPNQNHAAESVIWLMQQVEYNTEWAQAFGLKRGGKWTPTNCELIHGKLAYPIRIMAIGITGAVRGINVGGYRPDLIIVDDPCDEENTATSEQRTKISSLFFGAVKESLTPKSEEPMSALILLQTPLDEEDLSAECTKSSEFESIRVGILTDEDESIAESTWPARWSKETILLEKKAAIERNQLSIWTREKMCLIVSRETSAFRQEWIVYWEVLPITARYVMAIDPAPILSDKARLSGQQTAMQAVMVKCYWRGHSYVVEYHTSRDENPDELVVNLNRMLRKYPILRCGVEGVAYQRTLKWFIEREIKRGNMKAVYIVELPAVGSKHTRILQAHTGPASNGMFHIHPTHTEFLEQFVKFPNTKMKDLLDVSAMCDATISPAMAGMTAPDEFAEVDETDIQLIEWDRPCP